MNITVNVNNRVPTSNFFTPSWMITCLSAYLFGIEHVGDDYIISDNALKLIVAKASDHAALIANEALIPTNPGAYVQTFQAEMNAFLNSFVPGSLTYVTLGFFPVPGAGQAKFVNSIPNWYNLNNCNN